MRKISEIKIFIFKHKVEIIFLAAIALTGIYARFVELAWHFTNVDDLGIAEIIFASEPRWNVFHLLITLTNAPFEYLFTYFLISPNQGYRELLFWGRLPSCVAGILAIVALILFYRRYSKGRIWEAFLPTALLACSWENIAYAKQMFSYAIGVLAAALSFVLFVNNLKDKLILKSLILTSLGLAVLCSMQYQMFLFIPAFFLALFAYHFRKVKKKLVLVRDFVISEIVFLQLRFRCFILNCFYTLDSTRLPKTGPVE
jgi:hypothetical protein